MLVLKSLVANFRKKAKSSMRMETLTVEELEATNQWPRGGGFFYFARISILLPMAPL
jgi:hypothetical protein